jgi:hypothetical protein
MVNVVIDSSVIAPATAYSAVTAASVDVSLDYTAATNPLNNFAFPGPDIIQIGPLNLPTSNIVFEMDHVFESAAGYLDMFIAKDDTVCKTHTNYGGFLPLSVVKNMFYGEVQSEFWTGNSTNLEIYNQDNSDSDILNEIHFKINTNAMPNFMTFGAQYTTKITNDYLSNTLKGKSRGDIDSGLHKSFAGFLAYEYFNTSEAASLFLPESVTAGENTLIDNCFAGSNELVADLFKISVNATQDPTLDNFHWTAAAGDSYFKNAPEPKNIVFKMFQKVAQNQPDRFVEIPNIMANNGAQPLKLCPFIANDVIRIKLIVNPAIKTGPYSQSRLMNSNGSTGVEIHAIDFKIIDDSIAGELSTARTNSISSSQLITENIHDYPYSTGYIPSDWTEDDATFIKMTTSDINSIDINKVPLGHLRSAVVADLDYTDITVPTFKKLMSNDLNSLCLTSTTNATFDTVFNALFVAANNNFGFIDDAQFPCLDFKTAGLLKTNIGGLSVHQCGLLKNYNGTGLNKTQLTDAAPYITTLNATECVFTDAQLIDVIGSLNYTQMYALSVAQISNNRNIPHLISHTNSGVYDALPSSILASNTTTSPTVYILTLVPGAQVLTMSSAYLDPSPSANLASYITSTQAASLTAAFLTTNIANMNPSAYPGIPSTAFSPTNVAMITDASTLSVSQLLHNMGTSTVVNSLTDVAVSTLVATSLFGDNFSSSITSQLSPLVVAGISTTGILGLPFSTLKTALSSAQFQSIIDSLTPAQISALEENIFDNQATTPSSVGSFISTYM